MKRELAIRADAPALAAVIHHGHTEPKPYPRTAHGLCSYFEREIEREREREREQPMSNLFAPTSSTFPILSFNSVLPNLVFHSQAL